MFVTNVACGHGQPLMGHTAFNYSILWTTGQSQGFLPWGRSSDFCIIFNPGHWLEIRSRFGSLKTAVGRDDDLRPWRVVCAQWAVNCLGVGPEVLAQVVSTVH